MKYLAAWLLLASSVLAQTVTLPAEIKGTAGAWIIVAPEAVDGGLPRWRLDPALQEVRLDLLFPPEVISKSKGKVVTVTYGADGQLPIGKSGLRGRYSIEAWNAKGDVASDIAVCWVTIGGPVPPVVVPPPVEPPVNPPIDPAPVPLKGMRVLMIYESDAPLPPAIQDAVFSRTVDEYLRLKCLLGPDGKTPEVRRFDEDSNLAGMTKVWQDLRAKLPAELPLDSTGKYQVPHVAVGDSSGAVVHSGPVPVPEAATLELFKKFGGQ